MNLEHRKQIIEAFIFMLEKVLIYGNKIDRSGYAWKIDNVVKLNNDEIILVKLGIWNYKKE